MFSVGTLDSTYCATAVQDAIILELQDVTCYSVEFGLWTSPTKDAVLNFVVHYIRNGKRIDRTLDTLPLHSEAAHTLYSYKKTIKNITTNYGLNPDQLVCFISDGGGVNYCTAEKMNTDLMRCSAYLLSILVKDICTIGDVFDVFSGVLKYSESIREIRNSKPFFKIKWIRVPNCKFLPNKMESLF